MFHFCDKQAHRLVTQFRTTVILFFGNVELSSDNLLAWHTSGCSETTKSWIKIYYFHNQQPRQADNECDRQVICISWLCTHDATNTVCSLQTLLSFSTFGNTHNIFILFPECDRAPNQGPDFWCSSKLFFSTNSLIFISTLSWASVGSEIKKQEWLLPLSYPFIFGAERIQIIKRGYWSLPPKKIIPHKKFPFSLFHFAFPRSQFSIFCSPFPVPRSLFSVSVLCSSFPISHSPFPCPVPRSSFPVPHSSFYVLVNDVAVNKKVSRFRPEALKNLFSCFKLSDFTYSFKRWQNNLIKV